MKRVVLLGDRLFMKFPDMSYLRERAREADAELISTEDMSHEEIHAVVRDAAALMLIGYPIPREMIAAATHCELILTMSVGYEVVDVEAATDYGIPVSNCPVYCSEEVAQHAITLALTVGRRVHELMPYTRTGGWDYKRAFPIHSFGTQRFGIYGLGRIGRHAARLAQGLGMQVVAYDPYVDEDIFSLLGVERAYEIDHMLAEADYVSIHSPLTDETYHAFDADAFAAMKPTAVLINTARGAIVDTGALEWSLESGSIGGAGLDVLETEPPRGDERILSLPTVAITPHMAWYSAESHRRNMADGMDELVRVLNGHRPRYVVNPQIFSRRRPHRVRRTTQEERYEQEAWTCSDPNHRDGGPDRGSPDGADGTLRRRSG